MSFILMGEIKNVLDVLKGCNFEVLRGFYYTVKSFNSTCTKRGGVSTLMLLNEKGQRINEADKTVKCVETLTFTKDRVISLGYLEENGKNHLNEELVFVDRNNVKVVNLTDYQNKKSYNFEIRNNKVVNFSLVEPERTKN